MDGLEKVACANPSCDNVEEKIFMHEKKGGKYICKRCDNENFLNKQQEAMNEANYKQQALASKSAEELREAVKEAKEVKKQIEDLLNEAGEAIRVLKKFIDESDKY